MLESAISSVGVTNNVVNQGCMPRVKARGSRIHQSCTAIYQQFLEVRRAFTFEDFKWAMAFRENNAKDVIQATVIYTFLYTLSFAILSIGKSISEFQFQSLTSENNRILLIVFTILGLKAVIEGKITRVSELLTCTPRRKAYAGYFETSDHQETILFLRGQGKREVPAFDLTAPSDLAMVRDLSKNYRLIRRDISGIDSCNQAIEEVRNSGRRIRGVWLECHGFPSGVSMNGTRVPGSALRGLRYDLIEPDGHVVLNSCSTGARRLNAPNVAEWVKLGAGPSIRVTAPTKPTLAGSVREYSPSNGSCKIHRKWREDGTPIGEDLTYSPCYETALKKLQEQVVDKAAKRHRAPGCFQRLIRGFVNRSAS